MLLSWWKTRFVVLLAVGLAALLGSRFVHALHGEAPLRVVVSDTQPPFAYRGEDGELQGLIVDRWKLWQTKTGHRVEIRGMSWADALSVISSGEADVIDGVNMTPERVKTFQFSDPWIEMDVALFYHEEIRGITDVRSVQGVQVGVQKKDACQDYLHENGIDNQAVFDSYPDLVAAADKGGVSVFCGHIPFATYYLARKGLESHFLHTPPVYTAYGHWGVTLENSELKEEIAYGFALITPAEQQALREHWLGIAFKTPGAPAWVSWVLYASMFLLLVLLAALAWLRLMSRAVEQRTAALAESEERFRMLFENTRQAIALSENGHFIAANQATLDMLRMQNFEQLRGLTPLDISPELQSDGERSAVALLKMLGTAAVKGSVRTEWQSLRANGEAFPAEVMLTAIRRDEKDILHIVWNDITDRKAAEGELQQHRLHLEELVAARTQELSKLADSLQEANSQQQALFDAAMAGIVFIRDRNILSCNRYLEQMLGYEPGELTGLSTRCWYPDEEAFNEVGEHVIRAHREQGFFKEDRELVRKDGTSFWGRMQARAVDPEDLGMGIVGMLIDITAEREMMAQMAQARQLAEDAAQTKADFLANMSHEIRTPMNAIIGMAHLLQLTDLSDRQHSYLDKVERSSRHLLGIINDILDFSKIEAGKMELERVEFSLEELISEVTDVLASRAAHKRLELIVTVDPQLPDRLLGDPLRVQQILLNLANNAVKFTENGEIEIRAELRHRHDQQVGIRCSVRDTGIGISSQQQKKLFHSFAQADGSTTRKYGGSGLGLAISKHLVEMMNGQIGVDSALGEGALFWCDLPLEAARQQPVDHLRPLLDLKGLRVLVVDDNRSARESVREMLARMQFQPDVAASGREALECLAAAQAKGQPYQVVLLDWQMPGQDGLETARRIRMLYPEAPPRLALMAPFGTEPSDQNGVELNAVLHKPVQPSPLFDSLIQLMGMDPGRDRTCCLNARHQRTELRAGMHGKRVLLVEDNVLNQEVAVELLRQVGIEVEVAEHGAEALELVSRQHYDLILMDMQMPVMDGLTATRQLRVNKEYEDLPVVAMTANVMADDRKACIEAGMNDYLAKPIDPERLWETLLRWLKPDQNNSARVPLEVQGEKEVPTTPSVQPLPAVSGLDTKEGLRLALNDVKLYGQLLSRFVSSQQSVITAIREALHKGDADTALRLIHTLKGSAGQVGAHKLARLAALYEQELKKVGTAVQQELPTPSADLVACLEQLIFEIRKEHSQKDQKIGKTQEAMVSGSPEAGAVCAELRQLLVADDFRARQLLHDQHSILRLVLTDRYDALCSAVDDFEFEKALDILVESGG